MSQAQNQPQHPYMRPEPHISEFNRPIVEEFRANGGRVGGLFEGGDLLLLTTVGAKSGREHTTPLGYVRDGDRLLVVASAGGSPRHPAWYHNLLEHPMVEVEVGTETFGAIAVPAEGAERDRLFEEIVRVAPGYADYQVGVERRLPVVALERSFTEAGPDEIANLADKLVEIHRWLRDQLRRVRAEADAYFAEREAGDVRPVGLNLQLRQHCLAFCESLHFHHTGEDAQLLPEMERRHPHLRAAIGRLRAEHRTVDRIRGELERLLADVTTAHPDRFRAELDRMTGELEAHLDFEEESLIPVLAAIPFPPGPPGV
ncbi:cation-binding protein [Sphaerimonospora thailandensis]|uniref:Cation-binding protein n=2 Tax=Sphaerimonospora thailandensis TaxID=795644 RepID=A0A8J3RGV7_9ACTN|nr:cation-binding protein [Sphaerimonospora thailandensis]